MPNFALPMLGVAFLLATTGCSSNSTNADDDPVKKDLQASKGTWKIVSRIVDGKAATAEELQDITVVRDGHGKATIKRGDEIVFEAVGKIDPTKAPKTSDSTQVSEGPNKGKVVLGIYKIEGDTITLCLAPQGDEQRPTEFSSKPGSKWTLIVQQRIKP